MKILATLAAVAAALNFAPADVPLGAACDACMGPCIEGCKLPGGGFNKLCMKGCDARCRDACSRPKAEPAGKPVEGKLSYACDGEIVCRTKDDAFPCSLTTHEDAATQAQAEEKARASMTTTCASRWGTSAEKCSVNSLTCKPTY